MAKKRPDKMPITEEVAPDRVRKARLVSNRLKRLYPDVTCDLRFQSPFELLAATMLSAQCTDARVNAVTPDLFAAYPDPQALSLAKQRDVERLVQSTGFFREKAKNLRGMAAALVTDHDGDVPADVNALVALPGVGRKTAHVVLGHAFGIATGVVVDTHVTRIANLVGLVDTKNAVQIERQLNSMLPKTHWIAFTNRCIRHGRAVCVARRPKCGECVLASACQFAASQSD